MAETGAKPNVHPLRARALKAISAFTSPLLPDDYLELINPLWSTRELRGRVEELNPETGDATTVLIRPGHAWPGHEPGQYLRIGFDIDGKRHWRAYSITSDPGRPDGFISITPKLVEEGVVSPYVNRELQPGHDRLALRRRGPVRAPRPAARAAPVHLRRQRDHADHGDAALPRARGGELDDVVHLHSAPTRDDVIFGEQLRRMAERQRGLRLHEQHTGERRADEARPTSTSSARTGASARPSSAARRRCSRRCRSTGRTRASPSACTWSASSR